ncbi:MAG: N-acetyl-gamma-glutamyl-phosphate reductase [Anaerolineaceae bacterium]|nr:N-acetyl-gamma-glutamyl-phosphate reductase [Anaerolineaceae bacterium]
MIKTAIFGATGYAGAELIKILSSHTEVDIIFAASKTYAGKSLNSIHPHAPDILLQDTEKANLQQADLVFLCLPSSSGMHIAVDALKGGAKVIDLSADFRLDDAAKYMNWYGTTHLAPELLADAVYGLSEANRSKLKNAQLVANPGCYPTSVLLPIWPIIINSIFDDNRPIIVDSKSGVSGAGRSPKQHLHFVEVSGNFQPYKIGRVHRHVPEMEQQLANWDPSIPELIFTPHLLPVPRGILSTIYLPIKKGNREDSIRAMLRETYSNEPFIKLLPSNQNVSLAHVLHSNTCAFGMNLTGNTLIITSAIDNLVKGAAGQAVQNMNIIYGITETCGLT